MKKILSSFQVVFKKSDSSFIQGKSFFFFSFGVRFVVAGFLLMLFPLIGLADNSGIPAVVLKTTANGEQTYSVSLQILAMMTMLSVLPGIIMATTAFLRVIVVLVIIRQAIGLAQTPTNQILLGIALFMTFFIMSPIITTINDTAIQPYIAGDLQADKAFTNAVTPLKKFMLEHTRNDELNFFANLANEKVNSPQDIAWSTLIPSFITSELKTAFLIGFIIFLPFLIIDIVVASVLMSMGMMMLSPLIISLPFKIMLFVMIDGWTLILGSLASSFYV